MHAFFNPYSRYPTRRLEVRRHMIVIAGRARLHAHELEDAIRAGSRMAATSREEPGCLDYRFSIDIDDPLIVRVFEHWESADALEAHFATSHFRDFSEVILRAVDGSADFTRFEISSAGPLFG
jgi:quinol monooxygenase YgiN